MSNLKSTLLASAGAAAMLLAPLAIMPVTHLPAGYAALAEKGGNGNGNGGGNNGNGNGNGGSDSSASESRGNSGNAGNSGKASKEERATAREQAKAAKNEAKAERTKNLNSQLGRLNSLNRNINGLMNSSDPHMAGVRAYVQANAELDAAEGALAQAQADFATAGTTFGAAAAAGVISYDGFDYASATAAELQDRVATLQELAADGDVDAQTELDELATLPEFTAFEAAADVVADAQADVTDATAGTTDADLQAALEAAANKDGEITPEILAWAKAKLGTE
ncbi:MAG: hypothetical protein ACTHLT_05015 [Devosia sp.]